MTGFERAIRTTQHCLWLNRWFHDLAVCLSVAALCYAMVVLVQRLFGLAIPLSWVGLMLGGVALTVSLMCTVLRRESAFRAATELDQAAGLRERVSSGLCCTGLDDPFARAVVTDAERVTASLTPRKHVPIKMPTSLVWTAGSFLLASSMFLITPGLLKNREAPRTESQAEREQTRLAVKRQMDDVRRMTEEVPALQEFKDDLGEPDKEAGGQLHPPADIRHEAVKKIDRLEDAIKQKRAGEQYDAVRELRKMMRGIKEPESASAPTQKLAKALQQSDFKAASEEIKSLREQLATLKSEDDKETVARLSRQLDELAKQLEEAQDKHIAQKLEHAGVKPEDVERLLEHLKKQDIEAIKKALEEKGLNQQQVQKLADQLRQQQKAGPLAQKLAQAMRKAAQGGASGEVSNAMAGLAEAGAQLSELEMLEQEMNQLDGVLADLQNSKDSLGTSCSKCGGAGKKDGHPCAACQGRGQGDGSGMGGLGQGRGGRAPEQTTDVGFKTERVKVHTGKGAIIGQVLFDGEQVKGDVTSTAAEIMTAAERDASDRINRDRIPRQYQQAVKAYFSHVQGKTGAVISPEDTAGNGPDGSTPRGP